MKKPKFRKQEQSSLIILKILRQKRLKAVQRHILENVLIHLSDSAPCRENCWCREHPEITAEMKHAHVRDNLLFLRSRGIYIPSLGEQLSLTLTALAKVEQAVISWKDLWR